MLRRSEVAGTELPWAASADSGVVLIFGYLITL